MLTSWFSVVKALVMLSPLSTTDSIAFGMSVADVLKATPGTCGATRPCDAAVTKADSLAGGPGSLRHSSLGPNSDGTAGTTP